MKYIFQRLAKHPRNAEGYFKARGIFALFYRRYGLAGYADAVAQVGLRHFPF